MLVSVMKRSKNQIKIYTTQALLQNQLISVHYLNLAQSNLLPHQLQQKYNFLQEISDVFRSNIADVTSSPLVKYYIDTENAKSIKQRAYCTSHHHRKEIEKQLEEMLWNSIIEPSVSP